MPSSDRLTNVFVSIRGALGSAIKHIVPPKEIEDIVQETYVRVCQVSDSKKIRSPRSFMFRTARNLALDHVKRAESRLVGSIDDLSEGGMNDALFSIDSTLEQVCSNEEFSQFCDAVRYLPTQCRRAFVLKKVYGYSQREIAKIMKISESTVEKHIANGIKRCSYFVERHQPEGQIESAYSKTTRQGDRA